MSIRNPLRLLIFLKDRKTRRSSGITAPPVKYLLCMICYFFTVIFLPVESVISLVTAVLKSYAPVQAASVYQPVKV